MLVQPQVTADDDFVPVGDRNIASQVFARTFGFDCDVLIRADEGESAPSWALPTAGSHDLKGAVVIDFVAPDEALRLTKLTTAYQARGWRVHRPSFH